jgi:hypothetical protein
MIRPSYPALLLILLALVFAPTLVHPGYLLYPRTGEATDLTITHWPAVAYNVRSWRQTHQVPLWRNSIASGGPWAANPQSWLFYPPAWLFFFLPINTTFNYLLLAHLLLAALGTYAFGRRALGLKPPGAAMAGLAFALSPWLSGQLAAGHVNIVLALAWLPVALLGAHWGGTSNRSGGALLAGAAWAAAVLNHAQMAAFIAMLTVCWFLFITFGSRKGPSKHRRAVQLGLMSVVALLLSAALLVPLAEALPYLNRTAMTVSEAGVFSLTWPQLFTTIIPTYGGEPEQLIYLGIPVVILAIAGLVLNRDRATRFLACVAALAALFALGTHGPLFPLLARLVPGISWLRVPPRAWLLVAFGVALLAGRGLDALIRRPGTTQSRRQVTVIVMATLTVGLILGLGLGFLFHPTPPAAWSLAALSMLTGAALLCGIRLELKSQHLALTLLLLVTADLGLVRAAWTQMRSPADAFAWGAQTATYLATKPGPVRIYSPSYSLPQHTAMLHDLSLADGVDPFQLADYAAFLSLAGGYDADGYSPTLPPSLDATGARPDAALLGLLNVGYVASSFPIQVDGLTPLAQIDRTFIYLNEQALPRAFVVLQPRVSGDIVLERPIDAAPASIVTYTPNQIIVKAALDTSGLLVLSEMWYPGWHARVDGSEVPIQRVERLLRGVYLDVGVHTVTFEYRPWTVRVGLAISGCTALALLLGFAHRAWRRA